MAYYVAVCTRINELLGLYREKVQMILVNAHNKFFYPPFSRSLFRSQPLATALKTWGARSYLRIDIDSSLSFAWLCPFPRQRIGYQYSLSGSCIIQAWPVRPRRTFEGRQVF